MRLLACVVAAWLDRRRRTGAGGLGRERAAGGRGNADGARATRVPPGHPEGYLEGFATIYTDIAHAIRAARNGEKPPADVIFPTIDDGIAGMAFIEAAVKSSSKGGVWVNM